MVGVRPAPADDLHPTLKEALEDDGPALVEVPSTTAKTFA
jgi:thiamine pyrophosphate-dependent acetolactate synthase large subunit-like protein